MKEIYSDINIIGGGLIGAAAAFSLSKLGFKISLLEKNTIHTNKKYLTDYRTVAISEGTKNFLEKMDIWKNLKKHSEAIKRIKIIDRKPSNILDFDNSRRGSNLGYIIKNHQMLNIFYNKLEKMKNVRIIDNAKILNTENSNDTIITYGKKFKVLADLNIAADGKNSFVKKINKTLSFDKNYKKNALVIIFSHTHSHENTAYEFFYKNGPLAILPMRSENQNYTSSIVWTNETHYIDSLKALKKNKLISILNEMTIGVVGNVKQIQSIQSFPITAHINSKSYEKRTVFIGDSAHSVHPIAGQGWNLGMKDLEALYQISKTYSSLGISLGGHYFCKNYHNQTFYKAYRLYQVTDKLDSFFQLENPTSYLIRKTGSKFIQNNKWLKNLISDFAMGY